MARKTKQHYPYTVDDITGAPRIMYDMPHAPKDVWKMLIQDSSWTKWVPLENVSWTSEAPHGVGATRMVDTGSFTINETFIDWVENERMVFRFENSSIPMMGGAYEEYAIIPTDHGCRVTWRFGCKMPFLMKQIFTSQITKQVGEGLPKLDALLAG